MNLMKIVASLLVSLPILIILTLILRVPPPDRIMRFAGTTSRILEKPPSPMNSTISTNFEIFETTAPPPPPNITSTNFAESEVPTHTLQSQKLHGGLVAPGFDEGSCLSRYQSSFYRKISPHKPSSYLLSKLRSYEDLHKRCGPNTESYTKSLKQLKRKTHVKSTTSTTGECKYVVWIAYSGLGNRILSITAAFLYALLTNRVLLIDPGKDMTDLFCEPFPESSWILSNHFPLKSKFQKFDQKSPRCYGNMLKKSSDSWDLSLPSSYVYLHLGHDSDDQDKLFFCDDEQSHLRKVDWLIMKTDNYFVPSLFLMPSYKQELNKLFPEKETVFHHLGRYLFHPSNHVWGLISRYYQSYLAKADERIGIQVRTFENGPGPFKHVMDQILDCVYSEKLLPQVDEHKPIIDTRPSSGDRKLKSVLMTSLKAEYSENLRNIYWEHPTLSGDLISVLQPSHEGEQRTDNKLHDRKALAEMFLLSFSDVLVTSAWSTFGYVAQGLGGLKPWILFKPVNQTVPNPSCRRLVSMEPCFHAPPLWDCKEKRGTDTGAIVPHVRHCEDISWGVQLVESHDEL